MTVHQQLGVCVCPRTACDRCGGPACRCGAEVTPTAGDVAHEGDGALIEITPGGQPLTACHGCAIYLAALGWPVIA